MSAEKRTTAAKSESAAKKKASAASAPVETHFFDRDDSWMRFNQRVLEEAQDPENPLLERVKFLAITASNLDEFFEIRVAGSLQRIEDGYSQTSLPDEGKPDSAGEAGSAGQANRRFRGSAVSLLERASATHDAQGEDSCSALGGVD